MTAKIIIDCCNFLTIAELNTRAYIYMYVTTDQAGTTAVATKQLCLRGYHMYKDVVGEEFVCRRENSHDVYAVQVMKDSVVVGNLPRKISPITSLFLMKGGTILYIVSRSLVSSSAGVHVSWSVSVN